MHDSTPIAGAGQLLTNAGAALSANQLSPDITNFLTNVNVILNFSIGLTLTLVVVLFCMHLVRWAIYGTESEEGRAAAQSATRTFVALFLMVDIWFIIRLLQHVEDISPAVAYGILIVSFLLIGCWSLLGIGQMLLDALSSVVSFIANEGISLLRRRSSPQPVLRFLQTRSDMTLRFLILVIVLVPVALCATFWPFSGSSSEESPPSTLSDSSMGTYALPLVRVPGDASLTGNTYTNTRYGISITYPKNWVVSIDNSDPNELMSANDDGVQMHSELNAGIFSDLATSSRNAYLTALWRVQKNVQLNIASGSAGITYTDTSSTGDIASTSATLLTLNYFWDAPDDSIANYYDFYYVFGEGPVYYTLEFLTPNQNLTADEINSLIQPVLNSIKVTDPQLQR